MHMNNTASHRGTAAIERGGVNPWWYVVTGFISLLVGVNTMIILFNLLTPSLTKEFGWTRLQVSSGLSIFTVFDGLSLLVMGILVDRFGIRKVATPMVAVFALGMASFALADGSISTFYLSCVLAGVGAGAATPTVYSAVVAAWFGDRRGLALGLLNVGLGLCGTLMPFVINQLLGALGWRGMVVATGVICGVWPVLAYMFLVSMPADWERARLAAKARGAVAGTPLSTIARTRQFWLINLAIFLVSAATFGMLSQMVAMATDHGIEKTVALSLLSTISLSSVASRFIVGFLLDRVFAPVLTAVIFALCACGVLTIAYTHSLPLLYLGALLVGLGLGSEGDIAAYTVSRYVEKQSFTRVFGIVMFLFAMGGALGVVMLGYSFSHFGSYDVAIWAILAMVVLAVVMILALGPYRYTVEGTPTDAAAPGHGEWAARTAARA
jgi:MFS family permease